MLDRIMATTFLAGGVGLAVFLFHNRYAAPACNADAVTGAVTSQIEGKVGAGGLYLLNAHGTGGGFFSPVRHCQVDAAPIVDAEALGKDHWVKIFYDAVRDRQTGKMTVAARIGGPVTPRFAANASP